MIDKAKTRTAIENVRPEQLQAASRSDVDSTRAANARPTFKLRTNVKAGSGGGGGGNYI